MPQAIAADINSVSSVIQVAAAIGGAGQAIAATPSLSIELARGGTGGPVQYKVGAGAWITLDSHEGVSLPIDLSVTAVLLRKATPTSASIPVRLTVNTVRANQAGLANVPTVVVGTAAPSNTDGRPDGTVYIQTV